MDNIYEIAAQILNNLKLTSDNVDMSDCYYLCANKQHIEDLQNKDHQIIWGRRGTGKTTLLKAFTYKINYILQEPEKTSIYIVMAKIVPTEEEIASLEGDGSGLAVYVFSKLIGQICNEIENIYDVRSSTMDADAEKQFLKSFYELQDYLKVYHSYAKGGEVSVEELKSSEIKEELVRQSGAKVKAEGTLASFFLDFFRNKNKTSNSKQSFLIWPVVKSS